MISLKAALSSSSIRPTVADKVTTLVACHLTHAAAPPSPSPTLAVTTFASCPFPLVSCLLPHALVPFSLRLSLYTSLSFGVYYHYVAIWQNIQRLAVGGRWMEEKLTSAVSGRRQNCWACCVRVCECVCVSMSSLFSTLGEIFQWIELGMTKIYGNIYLIPI